VFASFGKSDRETCIKYLEVLTIVCAGPVDIWTPPAVFDAVKVDLMDLMDLMWT